jgi:hypothetical protein
MLASSFRLSTFDPGPCGWALFTMNSRLVPVSRLFARISRLECALTKKCVCNSFGMRTYKSLDLKSPGMNTYKKYRVGGYPYFYTGCQRHCDPLCLGGELLRMPQGRNAGARKSSGRCAEGRANSCPGLIRSGRVDLPRVAAYDAPARAVPTS